MGLRASSQGVVDEIQVQGESQTQIEGKSAFKGKATYKAYVAGETQGSNESYPRRQSRTDRGAN